MFEHKITALAGIAGIVISFGLFFSHLTGGA